MKNQEVTPIDVYIGKKIREKRQKSNLTLCEVGEKLGISHQQIQKYEHAQSRITAGTLYQIAKVLGVTYEYFFDGFDINKLDKNAKLESDIISPLREKSLNILVVEDDPADELFLRRALENCSYKTNIYSIHDGSTVLDFLRNKNNKTTNFPKPDIILLDINIPKRDGHEVLKEIKRDRDVQDIPVIIVSNGISIKEMISLYRNQAAGYVCKSFDFDTFQNNIEGLVHYWASVVVLPRTAV